LSEDHREQQRHLLHGRREDFAPRRVELTLGREVIEDRSVFRSEELLEPPQFRYLLFDDDAPWQYRCPHRVYLVSLLSVRGLLRAARSLLRILCNRVDAGSHIRMWPASVSRRYHLRTSANTTDGVSRFHSLSSSSPSVSSETRARHDGLVDKRISLWLGYEAHGVEAVRRGECASLFVT